MTKRQVFRGWVGYGLVGLGYFYCYRGIPFEITSGLLWGLMIVSFLATPCMIGLSFAAVLPEEKQENKTLGCIVPLAVLVFTLHHLAFTVLISLGNGYEDKQVAYPDPTDPRKQIVTQYIDQGAMGEHYRTLVVYELTPFLRYVESVDYR